MLSSDVPPYHAASEFYVAVVEAVPQEAYDRPWSDEWRILDLIAHGNRANVLAVEYLVRPVERAGPDYATPEAIAERARQAVRDLGDDVPGTVRRDAARARDAIAGATEDATVGTPFGTLPLGPYLQSRTAELVLHGLDLVRALDLPVEPPKEAVVACGVALVTRGIQRGLGIDILLALSGRATLPTGFNVF